MKITNDNYKSVSILHSSDKVIFTYIDRDIEYSVMDCYLGCCGFRNDYLFDLLAIDKIKFCSKQYGYKPVGGTGRGGWPETHREDYVALTRCVKALFDEIWARMIPPKVISLDNLKSKLITDKKVNYDYEIKFEKSKPFAGPEPINNLADWLEEEMMRIDDDITARPRPFREEPHEGFLDPDILNF